MAGSKRAARGRRLQMDDEREGHHKTVLDQYICGRILTGKPEYRPTLGVGRYIPLATR